MRKANKRYHSKYKTVIISHIEKNLREYILISIIFIIGILLSVVFVNNQSTEQANEISIYINNSIEQLKEERSKRSKSNIKKLNTNRCFTCSNTLAYGFNNYRIIICLCYSML